MSPAAEGGDGSVSADRGENSYIIRPNFKDKFRPAIVSSAIHEYVKSKSL